MPSQAEVIKALQNASAGQGLDPMVPPPQSPADVYAGAGPFAQALGLPDALKALKGQFTPEEAQGFALVSAMGLLPGAKVENAAVKTMGELLPHYYPAGSYFAKMTPKDYLRNMGEYLPKQLTPDLQKVLAPEMKAAKVPVPGPVQKFAPAASDVSEGHKMFGVMTDAEKKYIADNHGDVKMSQLSTLVPKILPQLGAANESVAPSAEKTLGELYPHEYLPDNPLSKMTQGQHIAALNEGLKSGDVSLFTNNPTVSSQKYLSLSTNANKSPSAPASSAPLDQLKFVNNGNIEKGGYVNLNHPQTGDELGYISKDSTNKTYPYYLNMGGKNWSWGSLTDAKSFAQAMHNPDVPAQLDPTPDLTPAQPAPASGHGYGYGMKPQAASGEYFVHDPNGNEIGTINHSQDAFGTDDPGYHLQVHNTPFSKMFESPEEGVAAAAALHQKMSPAQQAKTAGQIYPPISEEAINNALAKNPGASISDIAGTHVSGNSSPLSQSMGNVGLDQTFPSATFKDIPREGGIQYTPTKASILGKSENLVHGTRMSSGWETPGGEGAKAIGTAGDALRLPYDELGVHFGNPKQANVFSGDWLSQQAAPRQYPVVVATNNPLRLPDLGTWHQDDIVSALGKINEGKLYGRLPGEDYYATEKRIQISPEAQGMFPKHELDQLGNIQDTRNYLQGKGYDSVVYTNKAEDPGNDSYIKFTGAPEAPNFVTGVRSPFAAFDPAKIMRPELAAGIGGAAVTPQIQEYIKALQGGDQQPQPDQNQQ